MATTTPYLQHLLSKIRLAICPALGLLVVAFPAVTSAEDSELSSRIEANTMVLRVNLPSEGIYQVQYTDSLATNLVDWLELGTEASDGFPFEVSDSIGGDSKFYRVNRTPLANAAYASGAHMDELFANVPIADLRSAFGLPSTVEKTADADLTDLSSQTTDERLYLASLISLAKIASDIQESMTPYAGMEQDIANALVTDLSDGNLDGRTSGSVITIGSTSETLESRVTDAIVLEAFASAQQEVAGLKNLTITSVEVPSAASVRRMAAISAAPATTGQFRVEIPAVWSSFYWDSAEWQ